MTDKISRLFDPGSTNPSVFVIAEAGVNHNGSVDRALEMVDAAAAAGADAVKFQSFSPQRLVHPTSRKGDYQIRATGSDESQYEMLSALQLSDERFVLVAQRCREKGIVFLTTPFDKEALQSFPLLGVPAIKVSSGDITNFQLLAAMAATKLPIILSSGMSTLEEVRAAVDFLRMRQCGDLALLHCVSAYPTPPAECNLHAIATLRENFGCVVGFSDHTLGVHVACAAIGLGVRLLEKHFTLDKSLPGPDHQASLDPEELQNYVRAVREAAAALGSPEKTPSASESENLQIGRRGLYWAGSWDVGHVVDEGDLISLRPAGQGLDARHFFDVVGKTVRRKVENGDAIQAGDVS